MNEHPFGNGELPEDVEKMLEEAAIEMAMQAAVVQNVLAFRACMEQEGVNLEAAIKMTRAAIDANLEEVSDPIQRDAYLRAFHESTVKARKMLSEAYTLVRLDTCGDREPKPYDATRHLEAKARNLEAQAQREAMLRTLLGDQ